MTYLQCDDWYNDVFGVEPKGGQYKETLSVIEDNVQKLQL